MSNQDLILLNKSNIAIEFFRSHMNELIERFNNKFIAIKEKEIVGVGSNMGDLIKELSKKGEETPTLLIKFVSKSKYIL